MSERSEVIPGRASAGESTGRWGSGARSPRVVRMSERSERTLSMTEFALAAALVTALAGIATGGLYSVTEQWNFVVPVAIGALAALALCLASRRTGLMVGETVAAAALLFVIIGALVAGGGVPGPNGFTTFFDGLTTGWSDLLSSTPPTDMTPELRVVPLTLGFVGTMIGVEALRRISQPGLPVIGPLGVLTLTILFTEEDRTVSLILGAVLAGGALAVGFIQQRALRTKATQDYVAGSTAARRTTATITSVVLVAVAAPLLGPALPVAGENDRYGLRDDVVPPWDPLVLPSPLTQMKKPLESRENDEQLPVVFRVTSADQPTRFATSVLGAFDGTVFTVSSGEAEAATEFRPVGSRLPDPPDEIGGDREVSATIEIVDLAGPWVPTPGWPVSLDMLEMADADEADDPAADLVVRENINTGTLAVPDGLADGTSYEITAKLPEERADEELAALPMTPLSATVDLSLLSPKVRNLAADVTEGRDRGWDQMAALRDFFLQQGFYSIEPTAKPGHSFFRIGEFLNDAELVVGYEEQYAAAAALLGRFVGLPTRVVVGYEVPEARYRDDVAVVRQTDLTAWVEARVDGVGWVSFDVTPDQQAPEQKPPQSVPQEAPVPNPPPPPPPPPQLDVAPDNEEDPEEEPEEEDKQFDPIGTTIPGPAIRGYVMAGAGGAGGLIVMLAALVVANKAWRSWRRRHQRDPARRVAGAWYELADRYHEAGVPIPPKATPLEAARAYMSTERSAPQVQQQMRGLVGTVDRSAWHPAPPEPRHADAAWGYCDDVLRTLVRDRSLRQRAKMRLDPRPLWHRDVWLESQRGRKR